MKKKTNIKKIKEATKEPFSHFKEKRKKYKKIKIKNKEDIQRVI